MSLDSNKRVPSRGGPSPDLWPKWMWVAVPVLVVVVVAGLWWAIFSPSDKTPTSTPSPTARVIRTQPTQGATAISTLTISDTLQTPVATALRTTVALPTFTPTAATGVSTPKAESTAAPGGGVGLAVGSKPKVTGTSGSGLVMRANAGTGQPRVKTLSDGAVVEIIGGPKDANGYTWWQVRDEAGVTGWVADKWLVK
jgi:hypothetical protein